MRPLILPLIVITSFLCCAAATLGRDALVGKWTAEVTTDDRSKKYTDTLTFKGMKFHSEELKKQGFEEATYEDDPSPIGVAAKFSVTLTNKNGDTAKWTGTSTGTDISGELLITRKDGSTESYSFTASKEQKK